MSRQVSPSTDRVYGLQRVTRLWGVARATVYRHRRPDQGERRRPGPVGAMSDEALVEAIRKLLRDSPFHGEGHRKLWARLRFAGIRTSRRRVLRLMRAHGLLAPQRAGRPRGPKAHDGTITTERVDLMWGTDLTSVMTGEGQAAVFVAVDHCSAECIGIHASLDANRFEALEPVKQAVRERFGAFAKDVAAGLRLRHDHGSQGGFKWSSQHLDRGGCGGPWKAAFGSVRARRAAVPGPPLRGAAGGSAPVLGVDRGGTLERGRRSWRRRGARSRGTLVPGGGRHATVTSLAVVEAAA